MVMLEFDTSLTGEEVSLLEALNRRADFVLDEYKDYFKALAEFEKTGVLKLKGKEIYVSKRIRPMKSLP
ncbi:MAG: hypothetical protein RXS23_03725 [Metallosphaera yellowstonensis]|jgi:hypothetical protein|uniref:Uncharacterized protein n=1 Tax=Metallosphaera yellowstonensis MK1 TaxID=671065 RepID=H2C7V3_9CREN|nr:hypothetical protein [Metallosphaera yellowstonensis]EHP68229.1 hypothetical protein MetMK1DRAFT_00026520 [Metallosphaera yellowstonensis MK1]